MSDIFYLFTDANSMTTNYYCCDQMLSSLDEILKYTTVHVRSKQYGCRTITEWLSHPCNEQLCEFSVEVNKAKVYASGRINPFGLIATAVHNSLSWITKQLNSHENLVELLEKYPQFIELVTAMSQTRDIVFNVINSDPKLVDCCDLSLLSDDQFVQLFQKHGHKVINIVPRQLITLELCKLTKDPKLLTLDCGLSDENKRKLYTELMRDLNYGEYEMLIFVSTIKEKLFRTKETLYKCDQDRNDIDLHVHEDAVDLLKELITQVETV
jgi:hypothetical protein